MQPGGNGTTLDATALAFDTRNDVAVLRVAGLAARALPLAEDPAAGTAAAILGYPGERAVRRCAPGAWARRARCSRRTPTARAASADG